MVNINGDLWRIYIVSADHPALLMSDGHRTIGCCDNNRKAIYIRENLDNHMTKKVLCHELTHAAMFSYNIELTLEQEELLADLTATYGQEIVCMANKIFHRLKENRESYLW